MKCIIARIFLPQRRIFPVGMDLPYGNEPVVPSCFKKCLQFLSRVLPLLLHGTSRRRIRKFEIITEIAPIFFHYPLRLGFAAVVVRPRIIEPAVAADVQIASTEGTGIPPPPYRVVIDLFLTGITDTHDMILPGRSAGMRTPYRNFPLRCKRYVRKTPNDTVFLKAFGRVSEIDNTCSVHFVNSFCGHNYGKRKTLIMLIMMLFH